FWATAQREPESSRTQKASDCSIAAWKRRRQADEAARVEYHIPGRSGAWFPPVECGLTLSFYQIGNRPFLLSLNLRVSQPSLYSTGYNYGLRGRSGRTVGDRVLRRRLRRGRSFPKRGGRSGRRGVG